MQQAVKQIRIEWVDLLRGICILCVMSVHLGVPEYIYRLYSPFYLAIFFFVSGYLHLNSKNNFVDVIKREKKLIIPFLSFGLFNLVWEFIVSGASVYTNTVKFFAQVSGSSGDSLWFISCLIICEILYYIIELVLFNQNIYNGICYVLLLLIGASMSCVYSIHLPWHIEVAMVLLFFFKLGALYREYESKLVFRTKKILFWITLLLYLTLVIFYPEMIVDSHVGQYSNFVIFIFSAMLAICFLTIFCKKMGKVNVINFLGQNTLIYYALHIKAFTVIRKIICLFALPLWFQWILIYATTIIIMIIPIKIVNRFFPELIGHRRIVNEKN